MKGKWRKKTAVLLAGVFFVLSFSVEFAHQHGYSQTSLLLSHECKCEIYADEKSSVKNGSNVCFSCVYSKIPVVLNTSFQPSQSLDTSQTLRAIEELALPNYIGSLFNKRAPPQTIS